MSGFSRRGGLRSASGLPAIHAKSPSRAASSVALGRRSFSKPKPRAGAPPAREAVFTAK